MLHADFFQCKNFKFHSFLFKASVDDDRIISYKWEVLKGPTSDKTSVLSTGADSKLLQLQNLVVGIYSIGYVFLYEPIYLEGDFIVSICMIVK